MGQAGLTRIEACLLKDYTVLTIGLSRCSFKGSSGCFAIVCDCSISRLFHCVSLAGILTRSILLRRLGM